MIEFLKKFITLIVIAPLSIIMFLAIMVILLYFLGV